MESKREQVGQASNSGSITHQSWERVPKSRSHEAKRAFSKCGALLLGDNKQARVGGLQLAGRDIAGQQVENEESSRTAVLEDETEAAHVTDDAESESTIIQCAYETAVANGLFWYIQDPSQTPQLILNAYSQAEDIPPRFKNRFSASHNNTEKTFHLNITAAVLSDSATYICALSPTL
ncbi:UNVERIFIED_CONTAM: hypothetical protein FKN15_006570 [Acipenser sinensis]